ncbi:acyl-CoA synthetase [Sphingomonas sp. Leaf357]|uniref:acyl-CoA synthetase n=1 Tax=Sphingomonas sp. Leaf357 TaxID=1736350 RepID=UPI000700B216|nr:acyl-CoA synthetase [Sphingomonas sp. Leaf357]KQS03612.1 acyl-CoA synthetase [Sphingomonas sp. Leaf357]
MSAPIAAEWNFGDLLDATAAVVPGDRPALIHGDRVIDWAAFDARTNSLARAMLSHGLDCGDRIAVLARNIPEYIEIAVAAFKARLTYVNINYRYTTSEVDYVLSDSGARALFFQAEFADVAAPVCARLRMAVQIDGPGQGYNALVSGDGTPLGIARSPDDGYMLYTGGTTGRPKGVLWRGGDLRAVQLESPTIKTRIATMEDHVNMVRDNPSPGRVMPACPLMHGAGLNSSTAELVAGGTVVLLPSDRFDADELWSEAARHGVTRLLIVGDVFARPMARSLEANPGRWDVSPVRVISSAGLMWSEEIKAALVRALPQVTLIDILGASEASGMGYAITNAATSTPTGYFECAPATVIIDPDTDRILADDEPGEGWLARRPPFAQGYHGDPAKTAATFRVIGGVTYAIPGDLAARGADRRLRLIGRGNMCINSGGEKIFPEEIEEALKLQPGVEDAMVLGVPDPQWGKAVVALIEAAGGYDEALVRAGLKAVLAGYKLPKTLLVVDTVPRHASGKGDYRSGTALAEDRLSSSIKVAI